MATTAIWAVKDNLKRVLDYASNPEKTENIDFDQYSFNGLNDVIEYSTDGMKTEQQFYVSGINCHPSNAFEQMISTKQAACKTDGVLAFHGYQSFAPGEVTPQMAHAIGKELAEKMWGDDFEVIVTTHLDKKHLHNHFVVNSVSWVTHKRFLNKHRDYAKFRLLSDELCLKYKLSIIDNPKKGMHYAEWKATKQKIPTRRSLMIDDVERALMNTMTFSQFIRNLKNLGYEVKTNVKHVAIKPPGATKFFRLHNLTRDERYSEENIRQRILNNELSVSKRISKPAVYHYHGNIKKQRRKFKGLRALYIRYCFEMGIFPKNAPNRKRVHFLLREDLKYMDRITQETTLLWKNKIETYEELNTYQNDVQENLDNLIRKRRRVYNQVRRCKNPDIKEKLQKDIADYSAEIQNLRREVKLYEGIKERSLKMKVKLETIQKEEKEKERDQDERRGRNRRSVRENEFTGN